MARPPEPPPRKLCSTCGRALVARDQKGARLELYCPVCDGPDPLRSPKAIGWTRGSLRPPKRPQ